MKHCNKIQDIFYKMIKRETVFESKELRAGRR